MKIKIYVDGIWDLFHSGHVLHLKAIKYLDGIENELIVGIISDNDSENYKRKPIYNEKNRKILVESCKYVDDIIENPPLILDEDFINLNKIDLVCHGFVNDDDYNKQINFFSVPIKLGKFRKINYQNN
jgi:ethanolamine-phosphate cytidylyltransferase